MPRRNSFEFVTTTEPMRKTRRGRPRTISSLNCLLNWSNKVSKNKSVGARRFQLKKMVTVMSMDPSQEKIRQDWP